MISLDLATGSMSRCYRRLVKHPCPVPVCLYAIFSHSGETSITLRVLWKLKCLKFPPLTASPGGCADVFIATVT